MVQILLHMEDTKNGQMQKLTGHLLKILVTLSMKSVSMMHHNTLWTYITHYEHTYNALHVVIYIVGVSVNLNIAYNCDCTALEAL